MKPKTKTINIMLLDGGVGDHVGSLVAVNYILQNYPWITPLIWMPDFLVDLATNVLPKDSQIFGFSKIKARYNPTRPTKTTQWDGNTSPMKIHCVDYAFLKLCDENPTIEHKNYLPVQFDNAVACEFDLPNKYVVFTVGFTADVREWLPSEINKTAKYCLDKGYTPVFLGQTSTKTGGTYVIKGTFREEIDLNLGVRLIDKTTLLEATVIMQHSSAVLGVDNGLLHVAGCTDASIIGGFTTVSPKIRMAIRNNILGYNYYPVVPDASLSCSFCQEKTNFLYGHDYRNCIFKEAEKKNLCTKQITADKFIAQLEVVLK